jgi:hypothetical protein
MDERDGMWAVDNVTTETASIGSESVITESGASDEREIRRAIDKAEMCSRM